MTITTEVTLIADPEAVAAWLVIAGVRRDLARHTAAAAAGSPDPRGTIALAGSVRVRWAARASGRMVTISWDGGRPSLTASDPSRPRRKAEV